MLGFKRKGISDRACGVLQVPEAAWVCYSAGRIDWRLPLLCSIHRYIIKDPISK